jgi:hypothetical protein
LLPPEPATTGVVIAYGVFTGHAVDHMGNSVDKFVLRRRLIQDLPLARLRAAGRITL